MKASNNTLVEEIQDGDDVAFGLENDLCELEFGTPGKNNQKFMED